MARSRATLGAAGADLMAQRPPCRTLALVTINTAFLMTQAEGPDIVERDEPASNERYRRC